MARQTDLDLIGLHLHDNIPLSWQGLFKALTLNGRQLHEAELWFKDEKCSRYGNPLEWKDLLYGLATQEPVYEMNTVKFLPVFIHLPENIQHHLLAFLLQHRHELPTDCLQEFISSVQGFIENKESWCCVLFNMLSAFLLSLKTEKDLIFNVFCGYEYQFSSVNKEEVKCLTEELKSKKNRSTFHMYQYQDKEGTSCLSNMETDMAVQIEAPNIENERSISKEDTNKYNKDVICIDDGEDISEGETTIVQPAKRIKIEADFDTSEYVNHIMSLDHTISTPAECSLVLSQDVMLKVDKLREYWQNSSCAEVPTEIDIFLNSSLDEIKLICHRLQLNDMSESCLKNAFNSLVSLSDVISHNSCVEFLNQSMLNKILELKQSASRNLTDLIYLVAEKFSKPFIDSIVVTCIKTGSGNHQTEVICKVTKDVFNNAAKLYLLKQIRLNVEALDESIISIFQAVIDKKVEIEGSDLEEFLLFVSINSKDLINSTKYGKFLLALITKYGKQMSVADVKVITEVVHCHGTFLKKSLESALKRLKPVL